MTLPRTNSGRKVVARDTVLHKYLGVKRRPHALFAIAITVAIGGAVLLIIDRLIYRN
jgi:hypothetical protein